MVLFMNLYFRLLLALIRGRLKSGMEPTDELVRQMRVLPNDIDVNFHMNNGRYMTVVDLFIVEYFMRTNMLRPMMKMGWKPMFGGHLVTYQRGLSMFEKYTMEFKVVGMDEHWVFFSYVFRNTSGKIAAKGYAKGASVSKKGLVPIAIFSEKIGVPIMTDALPEAVIDWIAADNTLRQAIKNEKRQ